MNGVNEAIEAKLDSSVFINAVGRRLLESKSFVRGIADELPCQQSLSTTDVRWIVSNTIKSELAHRDATMNYAINAEVNRVVPQILANISGVDIVFKKYVQTTTILFTEHANQLAKLGIQERTSTAALMREDGRKCVESLLNTKEGGLIVDEIESRVLNNQFVMLQVIGGIFGGMVGAYIFKVASEK